MLNKSNQLEYKTILTPLFLGLGWGMFLYTLKITDSKAFQAFDLVVAAGGILYALTSIWQHIDKKIQVRLYATILIFTAFFHGTTYLMNYYFNGFFAVFYGTILLIAFWQYLTKGSISVD